MGRQSRRGRNELRARWGGACQICGYSRCLSALQFHHVDRTHKEGRGGAKIGEIKRHPERFILVCSNCHHELDDVEHFRGNGAS